MQTEQIARVCHEASIALTLEIGDDAVPPSAHWDEISQELKDSVVSGVAGALDGNTPEQSHEAWMKYKLGNGWLWGAVKSDEFKTHPLLVPYDQLPASAKVKDDLFVAIVNALGA